MAEGLRVRFTAIPGETPGNVLRQPLVLPAVLRTFGWSEEAAHSEYDTIRDGEFSQPAGGDAKARKLRELDDIDTLTIDWDAPWFVQSGVDRDFLYSELYGILRGKKAVELAAFLHVVEDPLLRMNVTFRSIRLGLHEGEPDTRYYTIGIKEWRDADVVRRGAGRSKLPTTKKLDSNDTLYSLSDQFYGTYGYAANIARANSIHAWGYATPLVQSSRYKTGSKIKIPKVK